MRAIAGVLALLVVAAIVGLIAKKQLTQATAPVALPAVAGAPVPQTATTPQQQVQQVQQAVQDALQQPRPMPDEK